MSEWIVPVVVIAALALLGGALWFIWRNRGGRAARGVAAMGTRYNEYLGLGGRHEVPPPDEIASTRPR